MLSVNGSSTENSANVCVTSNQNLSSQRFELTYVSNGYYKVLAEHSGKSIDVDNASNQSGANLKQYDYSQNNAQLWKFVKLSDGSYYIRSKLGTVVGIQTSSTNVNMQTANQSNAQKWQISKTENKPVNDGKYVIASAASTTLAITENSGNARLDTYVGTKNQKYDIKYVSNGYYKISEVSTGKVLDVYNGKSTNGTNLQTFSWNGTDAQLWKFVDAGNGKYYIRSKVGLVIDIANGTISSGTNLQIYNANFTNAQKWILDSNRANESEQPVKDGVYLLENMANKNQTLDVQNESMSSGANVQIYTKKGISAQRFRIAYVGNGYYRIISDLSGKVLDVANGSKSAGANVQMYSWNGTDAQLWRFVSAGNGSYYIISKTGKIIGLRGNSANAGVNVQMTDNSGKNTQQWYLQTQSESLVGNGTYYLKSASTGKLVLDISGGSKSDRANVQIYTVNGTNAQQFQITHVKDGYCKIISKNSGKALEYNSGAGVNGANVYQNAWNGKNNQLWKVELCTA